MTPVVPASRQGTAVDLSVALANALRIAADLLEAVSLQQVAPAPEGPLPTVKETALRLNVSPRQVERIVARGEFGRDGVVRIGRSVRIRPAAIESYIASRSGLRAVAR